MNIMFCPPTAVATAILACRSFTSLTDFRYKDVYVHAAMPYPQRADPGARGDVNHARPSVGGDSHPEGKRGMGNMIAEIELRSMDASDSTTTTTSVFGLKSEGAFGHSDGNGGVMVHTEMVVHGGNGSRSEIDVNVVDLEKGDSLSP